MDNLLVVVCPGDEASLFGGLLQRIPADWKVISVLENPICEETRSEYLDNFRKSAMSLGAHTVEILQFSEMHLPLYSIDAIAARLTATGKFDQVYTYNIIEDNLERQITAVAVAKAFPRLYVRSMGGLSDLVIQLSSEEFMKKLNAVNAYYGKRIVRRKGISAFDFCDVESYQSYDARNLVKYYLENFMLPVFDFTDASQTTPTLVRDGFDTDSLEYENPWDLRTSDYESARYAMELRSLHAVNWHKMVEIGACEGHFTKMVMEEFPDRDIVATEPNAAFYSRLHRNLGDRIRTVRRSVQQWDEPCDLLFISSLLYYVVPFPHNLLGNQTRYIAMSHHKPYHEQVVDPIMRAQGFAMVFEEDLPGSIEPMWNVLDTKEGTNVKIWERR